MHICKAKLQKLLDFRDAVAANCLQKSNKLCGKEKLKRPEMTNQPINTGVPEQLEFWEKQKVYYWKNCTNWGPISFISFGNIL